MVKSPVCGSLLAQPLFHRASLASGYIGHLVALFRNAVTLRVNGSSPARAVTREYVGFYSLGFIPILYFILFPILCSSFSLLPLGILPLPLSLPYPFPLPPPRVAGRH